MPLDDPAGRTELEGLLVKCRAVEERRVNPFDVDVGVALGVLGRHFPRWTSVVDLALDAQVLNALSAVLQVQEGRLRYEASLFLADPEGLVEKLGRLSHSTLMGALLPSWHPAVELEQVTEEGLAAAMAYWRVLPPWEGRWPKGGRRTPPAPGIITEEELAALGILRREGFLSFLGELWEELRGRGEGDYWGFIGAGEFGEMVRRAYGVAYLVTHGYAELEPVGGSLKLRPNPERHARRSPASLPVALGGGE